MPICDENQAAIDEHLLSPPILTEVEYLASQIEKCLTEIASLTTRVVFLEKEKSDGRNRSGGDGSTGSG